MKLSKAQLYALVTIESDGSWRDLSDTRLGAAAVDLERMGLIRRRGSPQKDLLGWAVTRAGKCRLAFARGTSREARDLDTAHAYGFREGVASVKGWAS